MEYVEGFDLSKMVKLRGPMPVAHAAAFVHQAALGLQHAHEEGLVHRDIKPGNLMLSKKGTKPVVKVLDFGLARVAREAPVDGALTHSGQMLGTPDYIAPEQTLDAQKADIRADIYSLGCTLYYLLSGGPPFRGTSLYEVLQAHHSIDAKPLNFLRPEVPAELAAVVARMMAKEPRRRYQTPDEAAEALKPFFKSVAARPKPEISQFTRMDVEIPPPSLHAAPLPAITVAEPAPSEPQWESLIAIKESDSLAITPATSSKRRPPWTRTVMAATFLFGMIALGIIITITRKGDETTASIAIDPTPPPKFLAAPVTASTLSENDKIQGTWLLIRDEQNQVIRRTGSRDFDLDRQGLGDPSGIRGRLRWNIRDRPIEDTEGDRSRSISCTAGSEAIRVSTNFEETN